jgi:hypothetical protein
MRDLDSFIVTSYVLVDDWRQRNRRDVSRCLREESFVAERGGGSTQIGNRRFPPFQCLSAITGSNGFHIPVSGSRLPTPRVTPA